MTPLFDAHPTTDLLLLYCDGEVSAATRRRIDSHLARCWTCRAELEDLQSTICQIVRTREAMLTPQPEDISLSWPRLAPSLVSLDTHSRIPLVQFRRLLTWLALTPRYSRVVLASCLAFAAIYLLCTVGTKPITAAELLKHAENAERSALTLNTRAIVHQRLHVEWLRSNGKQATGEYDAWRGMSPSMKGHAVRWQSDPELTMAVQRIYDENGLDWNAPISPEPYEGLLKRENAREDVVSSGSAYTLTASLGSHGDTKLRQAQLVVRKSDWHPVSLRLITTQDEYVFSEISYTISKEPDVEIASKDAREPVAEVHRPPSPAMPQDNSEAAKVTLDPSETILSVLAELHKTGADVGTPIEIFPYRTSLETTVVVQAIGVDQNVASQLDSLASHLPGVQIDLAGKLTAPILPPVAEPPAIKPNEGASEDVDVVKRIADMFGTPDRQEQFARELFANVDASLSYSYALRRLMQLYTPDVEAGLSNSAKETLMGLRSDYFHEIARSQAQIHQIFLPMWSAAFARPLPAMGESPIGDWRTAVQSTFIAAQTQSAAVRALLADSGVSRSPSESLQVIASSLVDLEHLALSGREFH